MLPLAVSPQITIPVSCLEWTAARSSGPGGQNVNKVESKVQLRCDFEHCDSLPDDAKDRLRARYARRLDEAGWLLITSQVTRDQRRNLEDALERLRAIVADALIRPRTRKATRPSRAAKERRLSDKRHRSGQKRERRSSPE
ncbi:MAG: alternative ribosome rescue aminoacyl-tRNA hydrolase ArfB [Myxococcales bacterium]